MKKIILPIFISILFLSCQQKTNKDKEQLTIICDSIFYEIGRGKTTNGFKLLEHNSEIPIHLIDTLRMTYTVQMSNFLPSKFGRTLSYEFASEKKITESVIERRYVIKFEKYIMPFEFTLRNKDGKWKIDKVNYNNELIIN